MSITRKEMDDINAGVELLPPQGSMPAAIGLGDLIVSPTIGRLPNGDAVLTLSVDTSGMDPRSPLACARGLHFEVVAHHVVVADGIAPLAAEMVSAAS